MTLWPRDPAAPENGARQAADLSSALALARRDDYLRARQGEQEAMTLYVASLIDSVGRLIEANQTREKRQVGWLVENGKSGEALRYRTFDECGLCAWTPDPNQAIRFARRIDADMFSRAFATRVYPAADALPRIVEHMWSDPDLAPMAPAGHTP